MIHFSWSNIHVTHVLIRCALFVAYELILLLLRSLWFMHMNWHMLVRCALFLVHGLMFLLLRSSWFMCMKWHTCWSRNWKREEQKMGMMERTIPCKYHWQCVLGLVLMASRGHFPRIDVRKTLRGLQKNIARSCWTCWFRQGPRDPVLPLWLHEPPCYLICRDFFQHFTVTDCDMIFLPHWYKSLTRWNHNFGLVSFKDSFGFERVPDAAERIMLSNQ